MDAAKDEAIICVSACTAEEAVDEATVEAVLRWGVGGFTLALVGPLEDGVTGRGFLYTATATRRP